MSGLVEGRGADSSIRRLLSAIAVAAVLAAATASAAMAVVGGNDASPGEYPAIAEITFGPFGCTGTLIPPDWVLSAGHCGSVTGAAVASPVSWPPAAIDVRIGGLHSGDGYDISLLNLRRPSSKAPVKVAGAGERSLWDPSDLETMVGWGATEEGGDTPDTLQERRVPITTDQYCDGAYSDFDPATMVCAGFPEGGVDTCQGDSGGPMFGQTGTGALKVVGATSFGEGCARAGKPGVYARVADSTLREWIRSDPPAGVD